MLIVVVVEALNCAMSVAVGTVLVVQLVPVFQSLVPGVAFHAGGAAPPASMTRKTSRGLYGRLTVTPLPKPLVVRVVNVPVSDPNELSTGKTWLVVGPPPI